MAVIIIIKPMIKLGLVPNFIILAKKPILNCFVGCYHLDFEFREGLVLIKNYFFIFIFLLP